MKEANDIQKAMIAEIFLILEDEKVQADIYPDEKIIRIYFELNIEFHINRNRLYIKRHTKSFTSLDGNLKRIPYLEEVFRVEELEGGNLKTNIYNDNLLHEVFELLKEYYQKRELKKQGAFINQNK